MVATHPDSLGNEMDTTKWILVTGGSGFIGSYTARRLHELGHRVRIADIAKPTFLEKDYCTEYVEGNLCDPACCARVLHGGVHTVLHFAANMGGMGVIHDENGFDMFRENNTMTINLLDAAARVGVKKFFYASTACVYPVHLQDGIAGPEGGSLSEDDVFAGGQADPQGLYGTEKLVGEILLQQYKNKFSVYIARFHNVYGPGGVWHGGREKAPAALARKAVLAKHSKVMPYPFEIWGNGAQHRSFLYIDDCVAAILRLIQSGYSKPLNIGSDQAISIQRLAELALESVDLSREHVTFMYDTSKPVGVQMRNSNNDRVQNILDWRPQTALKEGMNNTVEWVASQMSGMSDPEQKHLTILDARLRESQVLKLEHNIITFAVLLPLTSRGLKEPSDCLRLLAKFVQSLAETTWQDVHSLRDTLGYRIKIYLAFDHDDDFLLDSSLPAQQIFIRHGFTDNIQIVCDFPRGHICQLWRACAKKAWQDSCDYMALFGDDVILLDEGWLRKIHKAFQNLSEKSNIPHGLACVAFTDLTFPGMPTFPVIHSTHLDVFEGDIFPEAFINQDGDPFLFQLYRRFGTSIMFPCRIQNSVGGSAAARYIKQPLQDWSFEVLDDSTTQIQDWLLQNNYDNSRKLTIDVVIPSYRVDVPLLSAILDLKSSNFCEVMFIIIIDNPNSKDIHQLMRKYGARPDVRIRINQKTLGASASRNRGMQEAASEWIHFLDDDVVPESDLLLQDEKAIRTWPQAAGFVGKTQFPPADTIYKSAVHLAGVTYFWDIADKIADNVPWGVTANLLVRRERDGIKYDLRFPKTGGGEDIDYCIRRRNHSILNGREGFRAAPKVIATHPWWGNGKRSYMRFFGWARGDGALVHMFPMHCYTDYVPTSAQLFVLNSFPILAGVCFLQLRWICLGCYGSISTLCANILHDYYRIIFRETADPRSGVGNYRKMIAIAESSIIRMVSEAGRLYGQVERGELRLEISYRRFDWFIGLHGRMPADNEVRNSRERFILYVLLLCVFLQY